MSEPRYSLSDDKVHLIEIATQNPVKKWSDEHDGYVPLDYAGVCPEGTHMVCENECIRYNASTGECLQYIRDCYCSP
jgi:hypothetical protein